MPLFLLLLVLTVLGVVLAQRLALRVVLTPLWTYRGPTPATAWTPLRGRRALLTCVRRLVPGQLIIRAGPDPVRRGTPPTEQR